jgi:hypothetical protein
MPEDKAQHYRREAGNCLDRAEIAPDAFTKARMRKLAGQYLSKAAKAAALEHAVNPLVD